MATYAAITIGPGADIEDLQEAVNLLSAGGEIRMLAGTYRLSKPLKLQQSMTLIGAGIDKTYVTFGQTLLFEKESLTCRRDVPFPLIRREPRTELC